MLVESRMRGNVHVRFGGRKRGNGTGATRSPRLLPTRLVPFERAGGELLFNLLAQRYERRSTIITSNLAFSEWVKVFGDEKLTTALLDRLTHHAHILTTRGDSYRSNKRKAEADNRAPPSTNPKE
jgi:IstB-like ATP binding protein